MFLLSPAAHKKFLEEYIARPCSKTIRHKRSAAVDDAHPALQLIRTRQRIQHRRPEISLRREQEIEGFGDDDAIVLEVVPPIHFVDVEGQLGGPVGRAVLFGGGMFEERCAEGDGSVVHKI